MKIYKKTKIILIMERRIKRNEHGNNQKDEKIFNSLSLLLLLLSFFVSFFVRLFLT